MASYVPVVKNGASGAIFYVSLDDYNIPGRFKSNPTLAAGDVQIVKDGGTAANLTTLPSASPASSKFIKVTLSQAETNADNLTIIFSDQTNPPEWTDQIINIQTAARQIDDLAYPATSGRSLDVSAAGGVTLSDAVAHGGTLGSSTATLALSRLTVASQTANTSAVTATGNGTGHGANIGSGAGATGNGINVASNATNGDGVRLAGTGTGDGLRSTGGATGNGAELIGGATSGAGAYMHGGGLGYGLRVEATDDGNGANERAGALIKGSPTGGTGVQIEGGTAGTAGDGLVCIAYNDGSAFAAQNANGTGPAVYINSQLSTGHAFQVKSAGAGCAVMLQATGTGNAIFAEGGVTANAAVRIKGGSTSGRGVYVTTTSGDAVEIDPTAGHGINIVADGTSKHGITVTGGTGGTSDGIKAVAGTGGVPIRGDVTGNLVGTINGLTAAALSDFFDTSSGTTYASAIAGSVVKEIASNASGGGGGSDPWLTALPGAYAAGTAGKIVGDNLNATVSSRATQTSVDIIDDFLDTEIAAIKAKTDALPTDPADASDIAASFAAVNTKLDTIDDFVDTEIANIQSRLPTALVSGRMDSSVGAMATGVITAASIAADAITDAKVASDVTIASVTGSVGSVTGAVGSVTGAVGSVTGNVGGNVTGSVGSVAANGITATSLDPTAGVEIADAILDRNMATGTDSGSTTIRTPRQALRMLRNKWSILSGTLTVTKEDDTTASWSAAVTGTAGADPITTVDPA